jgi:quinol monooxygenase YgiN
MKTGELMLRILVLLTIMFGPAAPAQTSNTALYVATYIDVQLSSTEQSVALIRQYREASRIEPGNSGVDVVREIGRPNRFVIIEVWKDQSSFDAHERAGHTSQFRSKLKAIHNSPFDQRVHRGFAIDPRPPAAGRDIVSAVTHVDVPPQRTNETELLLKSLAEESRKDEGNVRYEVFQQAAARNHFTIFAVWKDRKALDSHETRAHTRQFREALGPMLGAPYDERLYTPLT